MADWNKTKARQEARRFAAALLEAQDQPDWVLDAGIPQGPLAEAFQNELLKIAARIRATIKG